MKRPDLAALGLVALCVAGAVVLVALGIAVPEFLTFAGTTALGGAFGSYLPTPGTTTELPRVDMSPSFSAPIPAPRPLAADPATGIIPRVSTHAP